MQWKQTHGEKSVTHMLLLLLHMQLTGLSHVSCLPHHIFKMWQKHVQRDQRPQDSSKQHIKQHT
jgi:hypothetical protein